MAIINSKHYVDGTKGSIKCLQIGKGSFSAFEWNGEGGMKMKVEDLKTLDTNELLELQDRIDEVLTHRRRELEEQLERIAGRVTRNDATGGDSRSFGQPKLRILPRYRSKKDPTVTWSGRGMLPKWMREEIKGTKLSKEDFRIS